jgi:hypothetical protein
MDDRYDDAKLKKWVIGQSLIITKPNCRVLKLSLIFLLGYVLLGEIIFRLDPVQTALTGPRIGSQHRQFEIQVARLEKLIREGESIDCIFLGNSMVWLGVDPLIVNQTFQDQTGQQIHCFNFGVSALPASSAGQIASMLVERYHPKVLIYGTSARDYTIPGDAEDAYVVSDTAWLQYQNGSFNLLGWLYTYSRIYQYKGHLHDILFIKYLEDVFVQPNAPLYQAYGLDPKHDIRLDVRIPPDFGSSDNRDQIKWLGHYAILDENLDGLRQIVRQSANNTQVIVIEMPFHKNAYEFFPNGKDDYDIFVQQVSAITASRATPFWRLYNQPTIAPNQWWDYLHLNLAGADFFSAWIGNQLANSYQQGKLDISTSKP